MDATAPTFLQALDDVQQLSPARYQAACPHFGCGAPLTIQHGLNGQWHFNCPNCTHEEIVAYLQCETSLELDQYATQRLWACMMLAPTIEVLESLLRGDDVPVTALDPLWVARYGL